MIEATRIKGNGNPMIRYNGFILNLPDAVDRLPIYLEAALFQAGVRRPRAYVNDGTLRVEGLLRYPGKQRIIERSLHQTAEALNLKLACELK